MKPGINETGQSETGRATEAARPVLQVTSPPATGMTGKVSGPRLGGLVLQHLGLLARGDGDAPRPLGLGDLAPQLYGEQDGLEILPRQLDVVRTVQAPI